MTVCISKYKLSKQQHTIALDYTLGENEKPFTDLYAYDFKAFFRIEMCFVKHEMVRLLSNQAHLKITYLILRMNSLAMWSDNPREHISQLIHRLK